MKKGNLHPSCFCSVDGRARTGTSNVILYYIAIASANKAATDAPPVVIISDAPDVEDTLLAIVDVVSIVTPKKGTNCSKFSTLLTCGGGFRAADLDSFSIWARVAFTVSAAIRHCTCLNAVIAQVGGNIQSQDGLIKGLFEGRHISNLVHGLLRESSI